ncbi:patatin-like protein [Arthrobacter sp. S2(2024)]|uniref:patatin-like protein n=1 Tax=Arthrobacter sp. S2(2024) TaxID=3111911 RepID=UPI002FCBFA1C
MADGHPLELRLALVCYGGVSLAVYMYGVTREVEELLVASRLLEAGRSDDVKGTVRHSYVKALKARAASGGTPTRVIVDVISGTSAGGMDGLFLAKAIGANLSQEPLKDLWLNEADVGNLVTGHGPLVFRLLGFAEKLVTKPSAAPLDGPGMIKLICRSLQAMDAEPIGSEEVKLPLMPEGQSMDLFVPITDGLGYNRFLTLIPGGMTVHDVSHRHVMHFQARWGDKANNQFTKGGNGALAFAARATSSVPGAFPPVTIDGFEHTLDGVKGIDFDKGKFIEDFFADYTTWEDDPCSSWFIDGGVLDNTPFDHAINAIEHKRAGAEVERHLVYIEPHPVPPLQKGNTAASPPSWLETIIEAGPSIPLHQPILEGLMRLRHRNARIEQISGLTVGLLPKILEAVKSDIPGLSAGTDYDDMCTVEEKLAKTAATGLGDSLEVYQQLRLEAVARNLSAIITRAFDYSNESSAAAFLRGVLRYWTRTKAGAGDGFGDLKEFFDDYDLPYRERQLLFLIQRLNKLYGPMQGMPSRDQIDRAKNQVYDALETLRNLPGTPKATIVGAADALFDDKTLKKAPSLDPEAFVTTNKDLLGGFLQTLAPSLGGGMHEVASKFWSDFRELIEDWPSDVQVDLLGSYAGYAMWDAVAFPLLALSAIEQSTLIQVDRISPKDGAPATGRPKLKGTGLANFAAFFRKDWRENDYIWGRLDATTRLLRLVHPDISNEDIADALEAVLDEEKSLSALKDPTLRKALDESIAKLKGPVG